MSHLHLVKSVIEELDLDNAPFPALPAPPLTPTERLRAALEVQPEAVLAGCAGTGKTYTVRQLLDRPGVVLCAPTAKAAGRLKEVTGRATMTVHRLIYGAPVQQWIKADGEICRGWVDEGGRKHPAPGCPGCSCHERLTFSLPGDRDDDASVEDTIELIVVDEASMVDEAMATDLRTVAAKLGAKLLWVGDPAQLPPVGGAAGVDLAHPDVLLDHVYRAQGGILELATRVRAARSWDDLTAAVRARYQDVEIRDDGLDGLADWRAGRSRRMAVVHTNKQRIEANAFVRQALGRTGPLVVGDRLIVRKNTQSIPVWNGEIYVVQDVERVGRFSVVSGRLDGVADAPTIRFVIDERYVAEPDSQQFGRDIYALRDAFRSLAAVTHHAECVFNDFNAPDADCSPKCRPGPLAGLALVNAQHGFAITCHASQGSEAEEVGVLWTPRTHRGDLDAARSWLYTAVTRAKRSLVLWT